MKKYARLTVLIANAALCCAIILLTALMMQGWGVFVKVACYGIGAAGVIFGTATFILKKEALLKSCFVLIACAFVIVAVIALMSRFADLNNVETDGEKIAQLTEMIKNTGSWGMLVYVAIQILQVVILPLPAAVCYVPGSQIWGALTATLLASLGVLVGSVIAYFIGRLFGKKVVAWIAGKEATEKYAGYIGSRGKTVFVLMQILPFFPDDILCMVAGLTSMNFPFFLVTMIVVRPVVIAAYCFLGSGTVIPFDTPWGIAVWIVIFVLCIALAVLSFKYQDRFEKWLVNKFRKQSTSADDCPSDHPGEDKEE